MENKKEGIIMSCFISFEGIDGSGKSTVLSLIYERMNAEGFPVVHTVEPTDSWLGSCVKTCIRQHTDPFITAFTFLADRINHGREINEWLEQGNIVLCDRYAESTYAYQGAQLKELVDDPIKWLQELSKDRIPIPDKTFVFLLDPKQAIERIQDRDTLIPFERVAFLEKVQRNYEQLAKGKRFELIDATQPIDTIVETCYKSIYAMIQKK
jgi:dTMP kinase